MAEKSVTGAETAANETAADETTVHETAVNETAVNETARKTVASKVTADDYVEIVSFYARQMRLLDELKLEDYAETFTADGVVDHAHRGERVAGRAEMLAAMRAALPRYRGVAVRHWFDHFLIEPAAGGGWRVSYCSLVTRTDRTGAVAFEPTFTVEDELVRTGTGEIRTRLRVIHQDKPSG